MANKDQKAGVRTIWDPPNILPHSISAMEAGVDSIVTSAVFNSSFFRVEDKFSATFFPLSTRGEGATLEGSEVLVRLVALPLMAMAPTALMGWTSKRVDLVSSS